MPSPCHHDQNRQTSNFPAYGHRLDCAFAGVVIRFQKSIVEVGSFSNKWQTVSGIPKYSPIEISEIYESADIKELEDVSGQIDRDIFDAFNAHYSLGDLKFVNLN